MKKTLIGGSLLAVFLILMLPTVAAENAKVAQSSTILNNLLTSPTMDLEAIRDQFKDNPQPQFILITLAIIVLKLLRWGILFVDAMILLIILRILRGQNNTTSILN